MSTSDYLNSPHARRVAPRVKVTDAQRDRNEKMWAMLAETSTAAGQADKAAYYMRLISASKAAARR